MGLKKETPSPSLTFRSEIDCRSSEPWTLEIISRHLFHLLSTSFVRRNHIALFCSQPCDVKRVRTLIVRSEMTTRLYIDYTDNWKALEDQLWEANTRDIFFKFDLG